MEIWFYYMGIVSNAQYCKCCVKDQKLYNIMKRKVTFILTINLSVHFYYLLNLIRHMLDLTG